MKTTLLFIAIAFTFIISASCSRNAAPVLPSETGIPVNSEISETSNNIYYPNVFGAWEVKVNTKTLTAEIIPARNSAAIGDTFDSDLSQFLMVSPCSNCLQIGAVRIGEDEDILLDIYMRHPFKNIATRPDLHGFDVRAIFMSAAQWSSTVPISYMRLDGDEPDITLDAWFLLNADGFTSHYDELVMDDRYFIHSVDCPTNLNPYLRFFESYTTGTFDPQAPSGYNVMPVGSGNYMRTAVFYGGDGTDLFFYIVADVAYGQSAVLANRTSPQYYLPAFNRTEPWRMEYWIENNNLSVTDANSTADVVVQVFDWQHNATVDPAYPNPANPSGVKESSKVTQVILSMPDMMNDNVVATVPESGDGSPQNPLQYRLQIKNEKLTDWRENWGVVAVRDELYGAMAPSGRLPVPASPAGFPYETQDILDYSYYGAIFVNTPDYPMSDDLEYNNEIDLYEDTTFTYGYTEITADFFMDPSHRKFQYKWDYDYDGVTFDIDGSGMPSPRFEAPVGKTFVGLRIRTNSVPPREYIYTIPVYRPGEEYDISLSDEGTQADITSSRGSNSIAVLGEKVVVAFSSNKTGNREIYVSIYDPIAPLTLCSRVTTTIGSCYDPVLAIIEEGANAGIYVVFTCRNGDDKYIMSSFGNPYAGGFPAGNIKTITSVSGISTTVNQPCLVTNGTDLIVYYHRFRAIPTPADVIRVSKSTDFAQTWSLPTSVDGTSDSQLNPSAIYFSRDHRYYVVWDDGRDLSTRGRDIYMTYSPDTDGITYNTPENLSTAPGIIHEDEPSIASYNSRIGIAYLQYAQGQTNKSLYLMDMPSSGLYKSVIKVDAPPALETILSPSLGMGNESVFTICYGHYNYTSDANEIRLVVVRLYMGFPYYPYSFPSEDLGITSTDGISPYPAVVSKSSAGIYAVESFIAHRSFRDGADDDALPFPEKFGYVDVKSIVIQGWY